MSLLYFALRVRCRRRKDYRIGPPTVGLISWRSNMVVLPRCKERSRSLSHLVMSFLFNEEHDHNINASRHARMKILLVRI